ncbi:MAG: phage baseplate upper protein, partial [Staphylococcus equorum]|nr:phage baseplate upper protein [Staphylococcus equorum]
MTTYKYKDINTSVDKDKTIIEDNGTAFYTEDKGTTALRLFIKWRDQPFNLDNTTMKPVLDLFHSDESIWSDEPLEVINAESGLIQYKIPNNVIAHAGNVRAKLFLRNAEQSVHVANFTFDIRDSGIEGAVEKEISVNLVDDAVRRIVKENAIELLNDEYKEKINHDVVDYIANNPDKYKGADGKSLKYADLTEQQKENLKSNITDQAVTDFVIEDE